MAGSRASGTRLTQRSQVDAAVVELALRVRLYFAHGLARPEAERHERRRDPLDVRSRSLEHFFAVDQPVHMVPLELALLEEGFGELLDGVPDGVE